MPQKYISSKQDSEIKPYILCLGNISKDFTINNMKKKKRIKRKCKSFSVDYNVINTSDIWDIRRYLMKGTWYKIMLGFIKKNVYQIID